MDVMTEPKGDECGHIDGTQRGTNVDVTNVDEKTVPKGTNVDITTESKGEECGHNDGVKGGRMWT